MSHQGMRSLLRLLHRHAQVGRQGKIVRREIQVSDFRHRRQRRHRVRRQHRQQDRRLLDAGHAHQSTALRRRRPRTGPFFPGHRPRRRRCLVHRRQHRRDDFAVHALAGLPGVDDVRKLSPQRFHEGHAPGLPHEDNQYHSPYVLEYWSNKHGVEFIGKMWREVQRGEDPVMTYKRLTGISQEQFNDEMFDAARRFVTWDMPRIEKVAARYANQHITSLNQGRRRLVPNCRRKMPAELRLQRHQTESPRRGTKVSLDFKGIAGAEGFNSVQPEKAGWRYGFLASKEDGSRVYSETFSKPAAPPNSPCRPTRNSSGSSSCGAPTEHWIHVGQSQSQCRWRGR